MSARTTSACAANRSGHTLAELMVIMSVGSALMLMSTGLVHRTMRAESNFRQQANTSRAISRLGTEFRRDVNRAREVEQLDVEGASDIELNLPDETKVRYRVNNSHVLREESSGDDVRRESFPLPTNARVSIEQLDSPSRVVLSVYRATPVASDDPPIDARVEAVVGRRANLLRRLEHQ